MPTKGKEVDRELLSESSGPLAPLKCSENPPAYGAQRRQDALWEGGNEALPPTWSESKVEGEYQPRCFDDAVFMRAKHRPLPGVRLDQPGQLVPGCEWYVAPHGRSYFVNHNTRTTSWTKPTPERLAGCLMPEYIIKCDTSGYKVTLAWLGASGNILSSTSDDRSIRQWTRDGKPVGKPWDGDGISVTAMAVSMDGSMVVCGSLDGTIRLWNIEEGSVVGHPWEGNNAAVECLDWSPSGVEVAGGLKDGTIRRWNPATGKQTAPPINLTSNKWVRTVKYSPQGDKFASGGDDDMIRVWSKDGELLVEIKRHNNIVTTLCWSKDGAYIFSASHDRIRKWQSIDGEELVVFQGHTNIVTSLCLSSDGCHLISASLDYSVRIWDLKTDQQVGDPLWHDDFVSNVVAISSDGQYFASAIRGPNANIYVWSLTAALKRARGVNGNAEPNAEVKVPAPSRSRDISLAPRQQSKNRGLTGRVNEFFGDDTNRTPHRSADISSPPGLHNLFGFLRSSTRPPNTPRPIQLQLRRLNFSTFPVGISRRPVYVAPWRDEDRYGIVPESDAEAAAAMQRTNSNNADSSTAQGQAGTHGSQGQPTQTQSSPDEAGELSCEVNCCCLTVLIRRRKQQAA